MKVKVIGLGGIGTCLVPHPLGHFLNSTHTGTKLVLIDGDSYEPKNRDRQVFHRLGNKAEVSAEQMEGMFPNIIIRAVPSFFTEENSYELIQSGDIVFLCVDNHKTRCQVSDRFEELESGLLISGGNELTDGNIQIHCREGGEDITLPIANEFHPEIKYPGDENPGEVGCEELAKSEPQLLGTNNHIASFMFCAFLAFLRKEILPDEVYIDCLKLHATPKMRSGERRETVQA